MKDPTLIEEIQKLNKTISKSNRQNSFINSFLR